MTVSLDMFDAASRINDDLCGLSEEGAKKAILMALVARGLDHLLVDPKSIAVRTIGEYPRIVPLQKDDDEAAKMPTAPRSVRSGQMAPSD